MANKNFIVKNGLEVGGQEVVSSSGVVTSAALGGQTLSTTDSPIFADLTLTGNLNLTGDINSYNVTDLDVTDQTITLGAGQLEALSGGSGIIVDGSNASILWDETNDEWDFNKTINVLADSDIQAHIGRAKIGYMGFDDFAGFAHRDNALTGSYALLQYSTGETYLNAASGRDINIRINNSNVALFNSDGNFGIGTTSLTNNTLGKTTYFGNNTSTITGDSSNARFWLGNNWYYNSGDKFIDTGYANLYTQQNGTHQFLTSTASGSAGQAATFTNVLTIDANGLVGIGQTNPATKLHVWGTNPVIRVSDDGTTGYSTLELRQQNTADEGTELIYDSTTGHTHLNTVYDADLKIATNTGSFGTTNTNTRLTVKSDGVIEVGKSSVSTDRIKFVGNTNISAPSTSNHDLGTRLSLYDASANSWYAIGIESNHMWFNADGGIFKFYQQAVQKVHIDGTSPMPLLRVGTDSTNAMTLGSVTAVFPYSGPTLIAATPGATLTIHSSTNSTTSWSTLANSTNFPDYLRNTATFNTINTSQQANIIVYLNVATKVYLARDPGWNSVPLSDWVQISDNYIYGSTSSNVYVRYLPAGTHSLNNNSALYFFEAPIGP